MKRLFINSFLPAVFCLFFLLSAGCISVFAQAPTEETVYRVKLRGGIKLKGYIQDLQPGGTFTFHPEEGSTVTYPAADIKYLKPLKKKYASGDKIWRYRPMLEIGNGNPESVEVPGLHETYQPYTDLKLYTIHGFQYKHLFFAGLGAGFNLEGVEAANAPVFADLRWVPLNTAISPLITGTIGYAFNIHDSASGFYVSPGTGVKVRLSNRADMHFLIAFRRMQQTVSFTRTSYPNGPTPVTSYTEMNFPKRCLDLRAGIIF